LQDRARSAGGSRMVEHASRRPRLAAVQGGQPAGGKTVPSFHRLPRRSPRLLEGRGFSPRRRSSSSPQAILPKAEQPVGPRCSSAPSRSCALLRRRADIGPQLVSRNAGNALHIRKPLCRHLVPLRDRATRKFQLLREPGNQPPLGTKELHPLISHTRILRVAESGTQEPFLVPLHQRSG
jgi:hypothetical protein